MTKLRASYVGVCAVLSGWAGAALAQEPGRQAPSQPEEVVVTGSRIERTGMVTPTPVTSVGAAELANMAPGNLIDSMTQLPQFFNNDTPQTQFNFAGSAGASNLNIRGIGANRTLVLLDGRRIVPSNRLGTTDINVFPEAIVERIEVVTGGASAAYGSDAVAGVANFILNTDFTGIDTHLQGGITGEGDAENVEGSFTYGTDLGDRGHLVVSADFYEAAGVDGYEGRDWYQGWGTVTNPEWVASNGAIGPELIIAPNVVSTEYTFGGLIRAPGTPLDRLMFLPDGSVAPFQTSSLSVLDTGTQSQSIAPEFGGGSGDNIEADRGGEGGLVPSIDRGGAFLYYDFDVSETTNVFAQLLYGRNKTNAPAFTSLMFGPWQGMLFRDNAFLPESVGQLMDEAGLSSVGFSRLASTRDLGVARFEQENTTLSTTLGFNMELAGDGFFDGWSLEGYYQYGENDNRIREFNFPRVDRIFQAMDAVRNDGSIVCRAALFDPARWGNCVPLDLLGEGRASPEAIAYATEGTKIVRADLVQQFVEVVANGEVWEDWRAGPVSVAFGASYREDSIDQIVLDETNPTNDPDFVAVPFNDPARGIQGIPLAFQGTSSGFQFSTSPNIDGRFTVRELFAETLVPLVSGAAAADSLNLSLAARYADYSGSGSVQSWKAGLDWEINDVVRLRGTVSRDVRAATLSERFDQQGQGASADDPFINNTNYAFGQTIGGNPEVDPEEADTVTVGVVYQPARVPGVALSVDWYEIDIAGAIDQLGVQRIVDDCFAGAQELCALITRSEEILPGEPVGRITNVENLFLNVSAAKVSGVDTEVTYSTDLRGGGALALRGLLSYLDENSVTNLGAPPDDEADDILAGFPRWKATAGVSYERGPLSLYVQERYIGGGKRNNDDLEGKVIPPPGFTDSTINDNTVDSVFYTDVRVGYTFERPNGTWEIFGNVTNLFDEEPPIVAGFFNFFGSTQVNETLYDVLGRRYTVGFQFRY